MEALQASYHIYITNVNLCRLLMKKLGNSMVRHSFREANKVADFLSKLGIKLTPSDYVTILSTASEQVITLIKDDQQGIIATRLVLTITCNKLACFGN